MKNIINKIPNWLKSKYAIATLVFLVFILFLNNDNLYYQYKLYQEQKQIEKTGKELKTKIDALKAMNEQLQKNPLTIEKLAREKYGMKKQNEIVFLFPQTK